MDIEGFFVSRMGLSSKGTFLGLPGVVAGAGLLVAVDAAIST